MRQQVSSASLLQQARFTAQARAKPERCPERGAGRTATNEGDNRKGVSIRGLTAVKAADPDRFCKRVNSRNAVSAIMILI